MCPTCSNLLSNLLYNILCEWKKILDRTEMADKNVGKRVWYLFHKALFRNCKKKLRILSKNTTKQFLNKATNWIRRHFDAPIDQENTSELLYFSDISAKIIDRGQLVDRFLSTTKMASSSLIVLAYLYVDANSKFLLSVAEECYQSCTRIWPRIGLWVECRESISQRPQKCALGANN